MTELGNRFKIARSRLDNYVKPADKADITTVDTLNIIGSTPWYQSIESDYVPTGSMNVPFTGRPLVNLIQANTINDFSVSPQKTPIRDTLLGRPIYRCTKGTTGVFYSNSIYNSPILAKSYLNFFARNTVDMAVKITLYFGNSQREAAYSNSSEIIKIPLNGSGIKLLNIPLSSFKGYKSDFKYMQIHLDDITDYSNGDNPLLETYCYSLTLNSPSSIEYISDYLTVGI